jgi:bifunctional non-homologous end joining protein LigD
MARRTAEETRDGIALTNLDAPLFTGAGATKRDLVDYLDTVAPFLVPRLAGRALSVVRVRPGQQPFMQKNLPDFAPDWIPTLAVWSQGGRREIRYPLCEERRTLLWFANQRAVEYHPTLFRGLEWDRPAELVVDLDPPEGGDFAQVVATAHLVRQVLADAGTAAAVKTSGSKGLHVVVPLQENTSAEDAATATRAVAVRTERLDPALATAAFLREERHGRVFVDATRAGGASVAAVWSPRVRPGVPVSFPVAWDDLDDVVPADLTVRTVPALLDGTDRWAALLPPPQALDDDLVAHGRTIPVARVAAMHEGKRRKRAREAAEQEAGQEAGPAPDARA